MMVLTAIVFLVAVALAAYALIVDGSRRDRAMCRKCGKVTEWSDCIGPVCSECHGEEL